MEESNRPVTKGTVMLNALIAKRKLKSICKTVKVSYAMCVRIAEGYRNPTWSFMNKFLFLIPAHFWFEEPTEEFIRLANESIQN